MYGKTLPHLHSMGYVICEDVDIYPFIYFWEALKITIDYGYLVTLCCCDLKDLINQKYFFSSLFLVLFCELFLLTFLHCILPTRH